MKTFILLLGILAGISMASCHDITVGYLSTENASYDPDTLEIRRELMVDSTKNPLWERYWEWAESDYLVFG